MRFADPRRQAAVIIKSSIKFSAGGFVDCTMNTSRPRTFSINSTLTSPSLKRPTSARPNCTCKCGVISFASDGFALPVNTAIVNASNSFLCDMGLSSKLAGVEGFEPPYGGIKTRCLTAWRHPNLESTIGETSGAETQAVANLSSKGESFSPRTKKPFHPGGNSLKISRPPAGISQAKKTQAPVPVRRAGPKPDNQSSARATSGYRRRTTLKQSFRPPDARKPCIVMGAEFLVNS